MRATTAQFFTRAGRPVDSGSGSVVEPLSILLNPYRPLPLAGVVFSEASVEAGRSVRHHWGRDNRWETIPDSVLWLPAGLRPRKQEVNWMRGMSVAAAA